MNIDNYAGAFLKRDGHYLLMKRSPNKKHAPGLWAGIGGRMDACDQGSPEKTILREIEEESGIAPDKVISLRLMYIIIEAYDGDINQLYIFFGGTSQADIIQTDEGELSWVPEGQLMEREYTKKFTSMLRHYLARCPSDDSVYVGVANNDSTDINWQRIM